MPTAKVLPSRTFSFWWSHCGDPVCVELATKLFIARISWIGRWTNIRELAIGVFPSSGCPCRSSQNWYPMSWGTIRYCWWGCWFVEEGRRNNLKYHSGRIVKNWRYFKSATRWYPVQVLRELKLKIRRRVLYLSTWLFVISICRCTRRLQMGQNVLQYLENGFRSEDSVNILNKIGQFFERRISDV